MAKVVLVTGMQAAGKSTIAPLLAEQLGPPAATLDGDVFYHGVRAGAVDMTPDPDPEAIRQLELRYDASAMIAQHYAAAGFDFTCSDIVLGDYVARWFERLTGVDKYLVVLTPSIESVAARERARGRGDAYRAWQRPGRTLEDAIRELHRGLDELPRRGLWLDTTDQTPEQSAAAVLSDLEKARW